MNSLFSSISYYQTYLTSDELLLFLIEKYSFRWLNTSDTRVPSLLLWQLLSWLFFLGNLPRIFYFYGFLFFRSRPVCGYFIFLVRSMDFLPPRSADILFFRSDFNFPVCGYFILPVCEYFIFFPRPTDAYYVSLVYDIKFCLSMDIIFYWSCMDIMFCRSMDIIFCRSMDVIFCWSMNIIFFRSMDIIFAGLWILYVAGIWIE